MNYQNDSVRRQDRLLDQPEATELLRRGEYGILCMQRPEGGGYGVPLNYVWDEADAIYIHCAPEGRKLHCLRECDRVTFCIVGKTQVLPARFTTFYESILLDCRARTGLTAEERRRALNHLIGKYSPGVQDNRQAICRKVFPPDRDYPARHPVVERKMQG